MPELTKELLWTVIPLRSLTQAEWDEFDKFKRIVELTDGEESAIYKVLDVMRTNQIRIDVINRCL